MQVNAAGGGHFDRNVLKNIVHRSGPDLMSEISSKCDRHQTDYIEHVTELADYVDELWNERSLNRNAERSSRDGSQVNTVDSKKVENHTCNYCKQKGHITRDYKDRKKGAKREERTDKKSVAFSVGHEEKVAHGGLLENPANAGWHNSIEWTLDSGCGRHLTGSPDFLGEITNNAGTTLVLPDGTRTRSLQKGNIKMVINVNREARHIVVEYVPGFKRSLSYVSLEKKGARIKYEGDKRYLVSKFGKKLVKVKSKGDVLVGLAELWQMQFWCITLSKNRNMCLRQFMKTHYIIGTNVLSISPMMQLKLWRLNPAQESNKLIVNV
jgi:hypothetical protein